LHIVLDCAHGAASSLAPQLFGDLGAQITTIGTSPNGININDGVGSTHPEALQQAVMEHNADLGLAFDGDADRLIAVDENGQIVDGDHILYICAKTFKEQGRLKENTVVTTVMGNLGLHKALEQEGIQVRTTPVGDRYVLEEMLDKGLNLGGEPSGHLIFLDYNSTGDGLLSALQLVNILQEKNRRLSELAEELVIFPQIIINVKVTDKHRVVQNEQVQAKIKEVEQEMAGDGRVLVRPSGTEPLVRVMVEAKDSERLERWAESIAAVVRREMGVE
jgi:phosphoglucosamine mutase